MSASSPARNWTKEVASAGSFTFPSPAFYCQVQGSGTVVLKNEDGSTLTRHCSGGEILTGTFTELTSTTATYIVLGNGPVPPSNATQTVADLYQNAQSTLGLIWLPAPTSFYLLTGAPLAIFADGSTTVPGSSLDGSKSAGVRWNNDAAPAAVMASFMIPPDMDITANATLHVRAAKTAATNNAGNTPTFAIGLFNQVDAALYDADTDFGGTTSAMLPAATAKTIQNVTLTIALADLAAYPASVTLTCKPTAGTLNTDDLVMQGIYILYKKKLLTQ